MRITIPILTFDSVIFVTKSNFFDGRKTNFYTPTKVALSFRMCPKFLPSVEYPQPLYGMFFVVGSEFRGFHLVCLQL